MFKNTLLLRIGALFTIAVFLTGCDLAELNRSNMVRDIHNIKTVCIEGVSYLAYRDKNLTVQLNQESKVVTCSPNT